MSGPFKAHHASTAAATERARGRRQCARRKNGRRALAARSRLRHFLASLQRVKCPRGDILFRWAHCAAAGTRSAGTSPSHRCESRCLSPRTQPGGRALIASMLSHHQRSAHPCAWLTERSCSRDTARCAGSTKARSAQTTAATRRGCRACMRKACATPSRDHPERSV